MMYTRKSNFLFPPPVHMRPHETDPLPSSGRNTCQFLETASTMTFRT